MPDARFVRETNRYLVTPVGAVSAGELRQLPDGRAGYYNSSSPASSGTSIYYDPAPVTVAVPKTTGISLLAGGRVYWDYSAGTATYKKVNDQDFYAGRAVVDAASADGEVFIALNIDPPYDYDLASDPFVSSLTGTVAVAGCNIFRRGGAHNFVLSSTSEVQKLDALGRDGFATAANAIVEMAFCVPNDGAGSNTDVSLGIASATHATDADAIAQHLFVHLDGNATAIKLQSKDGSTTVTATDTTTTYTEGATNLLRKEVWFDMRNPADVQCYVDGSLVLAATVFDVSAGASTWFLLAHVEKSSSADVYEISVDWLRARLGKQ